MNRALIIYLSVILCSCDSGVLWSDHPYEVHWVDTGSNVTLARRINGGPDTIGRVDAEVIAVGSNDKFVVAKQRVIGSDSISYFYVEKSKDSTYLNLSEITQGPFSEARFSKLKAELELPDFTKEF
ncbi:hypothetical protein [Gallaecimonas pentaromativorans]|uniref:hypothetical protein n=1 Tax=Gallaecimonas pentaromativorans TaxID=584787 RepID=UPI001474469F|nr:hypothetical protein [Gallaecimonas pentaromativorans]